MRFRDLTGQRFSRLVVLERVHLTPRRTHWRCQCDCGATTLVMMASLTSGATISCGCYGRSIIGNRSRTHGQSGTPEYQVWAQMRQRCGNPKDHSYANYGGRGITVCDRWHTFAHFFADMGRRPGPKYTLDRIDNARGYEPGNCRWTTYSVQLRNTRQNRRLTLNGRTQLIVEWAAELDMSQDAINGRLRHGWSEARTLTTPVRKYVSHR